MLGTWWWESPRGLLMAAGRDASPDNLSRIVSKKVLDLPQVLGIVNFKDR